MTITIAMFLTALRRLRPHDAVLVVTNPPLLPFAIMAAARIRRARTVLLIHDVYPEVFVAAGFASPRSLFVRAWAVPTRRLYLSAARIVVLGRDMESLVQKKLGAAETPVVIIPNWGDVAMVQPADKSTNPILRQLGISEHFVVQFMGNMGRTHGVETLAAAAELLRGDEGIHFLFIGWGSRRSWLEEHVAKRHLRNITVLPPCARDGLVDHLTACDIACIPFVPGMAGVSVPSRLYNVLAAGRPVLGVADEESELAAVVREEEVGWVVTPGNAKALAATIQAIASHPEDLAEMSMRARRAAEEKYTLDVVTRQYETLFDELHLPL